MEEMDKNGGQILCLLTYALKYEKYYILLTYGTDDWILPEVIMQHLSMLPFYAPIFSTHNFQGSYCSLPQPWKGKQSQKHSLCKWDNNISVQISLDGTQSHDHNYLQGVMGNCSLAVDLKRRGNVWWELALSESQITCSELSSLLC